MVTSPSQSEKGGVPTSRARQDTGPKEEEGLSLEISERSASGASTAHTQAGTSDTKLVPGTPERVLAERRLLRKLDLRLLPAVATIYILNYIDRTGMTTARLKGFQQDLGLSDIQYAMVLSILYVTYCPAQIPSNMILNKITKPSVYISCCVIAWGLASALTGITTDLKGVVICRIFIGFPEAAFYPGAVYLLSCWYTKKELAFRSAILYAGLIISNAFGSLMAAGIFSGMEGVRGIRAWRWLFLIEGSITMAAGFSMMWVLPDYPHNTRWMTPIERRLAQTRVSESAGEADKDTSGDSPMRGLIMAIEEPIVWLFAVMGMILLAGTSNSAFFPTLAKTLGYDTTVTLLLAAAPWIVSAVVCIVNSWHADQTGERFFHMAVPWCSVIAGYIIGICTMSTPARYFSMFLMACGSPAYALLLPWAATAVPRPPAKRAAALALINAVSSLGSLSGSFIWPTAWGPTYRESMGISLSCVALAITLAFVIRQLLIRKNKQLDADEQAFLTDMNSVRVKDAAILEGISYDEALERRKGVRYVY